MTSLSLVTRSLFASRSRQPVAVASSRSRRSDSMVCFSSAAGSLLPLGDAEQSEGVRILRRLLDFGVFGSFLGFGEDTLVACTVNGNRFGLAGPAWHNDVAVSPNAPSSTLVGSHTYHDRVDILHFKDRWVILECGSLLPARRDLATESGQVSVRPPNKRLFLNIPRAKYGHTILYLLVSCLGVGHRVVHFRGVS